MPCPVCASGQPGAERGRGRAHVVSDLPQPTVVPVDFEWILCFHHKIKGLLKLHVGHPRAVTVGLRQSEPQESRSLPQIRAQQGRTSAGPGQHLGTAAWCWGAPSQLPLRRTDALSGPWRRGWEPAEAWRQLPCRVVTAGAGMAWALAPSPHHFCPFGILVLVPSRFLLRWMRKVQSRPVAGS